ncbi:MAG: DASH family cryptochrome [Pseudanabaenaceae cyanobacterium]
MSAIVVWLRNDLRVHDHEPLWLASRSGQLVIPLYCFDPRQFGTTSFGFPKTGTWRARFLLESVSDLRQNLQKLGSSLVVRTGLPELVIPELIAQLGSKSPVTAVYFHREVTAEELLVEKKLQKNLPNTIKLCKFEGHTLYRLTDLPFAIEQIPELFTNFRKQVEQHSQVGQVCPTPEQLPPLPSSLDCGKIPDLNDLGVENKQPDPRAVITFHGGETAGKARVKYYFWESDRLRTYKETRNQMLGADYSSKFSPWLALGCLSPRYIYYEVKKYETARVANDSTYWLVFELLWRDYFRFICAKHGHKVFRPSGLQGIDIPWRQDWELFDRWREGLTGFPLVDANMRELKLTGFMSNRGRQNVASFLTKNLGIDWRMGAEWFESLLIDYDVCSNYGNWNYTAGVGNDGRGFRWFNIYKQAQDYDPKGEYVKYWLPELQLVSSNKVHQPSQLLPVELTRANLRLGVDYPYPIVDLFASAKKKENIYKSLK